MPYPKSIHNAATVVYDGPMPRTVEGYYSVAPIGSRRSYVYILRDADGDAVYVGMSVRPGNRIDRHRRKPWWCNVEHLTILEVVGDSRYVAQWSAKRLESRMIRELAPYCNIAERVSVRG